MYGFNTPTDGALFLFDQGIKVFPLQAGTKVPPKGLSWKTWGQEATRQSIIEYANRNPKCNWAVDCGSSNLMVFDIDVGIDKVTGEPYSGFETLKSLPPITKTFSVKTPRGGMHKYYIGTSVNSVGEVGKGLDTRSVGGYVVAPGSVDAKGIQYHISDNCPLTDMPIWIHAKLQEKKKDDRPKNTDDFLDSFEEGSRNNSYTKLAGHLRAIGMDKDLILLAMTEVNERISNPLPEKELEIIAWSMGKKAPGNALATAKAVADFAQVVPGEVIQFHNFQDVNIKAIPPVKWILKNQFISGLVSLLVSPGGLGKSLLSLLQAVSVSTGIPLSGDIVSTPGRVWIHNAEDGKADLERRLAAISIHHKIGQELFKNITYTTGLSYKINLAASSKQGVVKNQNEIDRIKQLIKDNGIVLWLIDPFIRMHRVDENSNEEMDVIMEILTDIAQHTKCAIGIVHHTNKSGSNTTGDANASRGASAVVNATRIANTIRRMNSEEAGKLRAEGEFKTIPPEDVPWYIRMDNAKANFQKPMEYACWYKKVSVQLPNGEEVGCLEKVVLHNSDRELKEQQRKVRAESILACVVAVMGSNTEMTLNQVSKSIVMDVETDNLMSKPSLASVRRMLQSELAVEREVNGYRLSVVQRPTDKRMADVVLKQKVDNSFLM